MTNILKPFRSWIKRIRHRLTVFFEEFFPDFYTQLDSDFRANFRRGQILRTHVYYAEENLNIWRPVKSDSTKTSASEFSMFPPPDNAFRRDVPLYAPPLKINEEFIVVRAKERFVILIAPNLIWLKPKRSEGGQESIFICALLPRCTR